MMTIYPASWSILNKAYSKHHIRWNEVEEIFENRPRIFRILAKDQYGEIRYRALGRTYAGRYLIVVFVRDKERNIKVITSREMTKAEKKQYEGR